MEQVTKRRSRYHFTGEHGDTERRRIVPGDLDLFEALHWRYGATYLPTNWLQAVCARDYDRFTRRWGNLSREGKDKETGDPLHPFYFKRVLEGVTALSKHVLLTLTREGEAELIKAARLDKSYPRPGDKVPHRLINDLTDASFRIACAESDDLAFNNRLEVPYPFNIQLTDRKLRPDGSPFSLERKLPSGKTAALYFVKEIDRSTEPFESNDPKRHKDIYGMFEDYKECFDDRLYKQFFPNCLVLVIANSEHRMRGLMNIAAKVFMGRCSYVLFDWMPDYTRTALPETFRLYDEAEGSCRLARLQSSSPRSIGNGKTTS